ncbi:MAG: hypothetical protein KBD07_05065 [Candidatus Omnitrophica bacterium]|nr:hypothetical protein [Candidatus Omnitrophota bacterium]
MGLAAALLLGSAAASVSAFENESGTNISGEGSASERRQLLKDSDVRIEVPGSELGPQRPVRGLSRTEKAEMDDLEYRYQMGLIGEAEYYSRRNAMMQRIGMEPDF